MYSRCVEAVNFTHNPQHAQMDVKLRSLICLGLNEQVSYGNIGCGVSCSWIEISYIPYGRHHKSLLNTNRT